MADPIHPPPQRRTLYLLLATFFVPLAAAFILYYGVGWRPAGGSNHGELLQPLKQLPEAVTPAEGKWALLYVGDGACDEDCRTALYTARQVHVLLNKDADRLQRLFVATGNCCDRAFLESEHQGLQVIDGSDAATREALRAVLPASAQAQDLFIVDPLRNLVLRFDTREDPKGLLSDLKKLLKLSHIG